MTAANKMSSMSYLPVVNPGYTRPGWVVSQGVACHPHLRPDVLRMNGEMLPPIQNAPHPGHPLSSLDFMAAAYTRPRPNRVGFATSLLPLPPRANGFTSASYL